MICNSRADSDHPMNSIEIPCRGQRYADRGRGEGAHAPPMSTKFQEIWSCNRNFSYIGKFHQI